MGKCKAKASSLEMHFFLKKNIYFPVGFLERAGKVIQAMIGATIREGQVDYRTYHPTYKVLSSFASQVKKYNNGNESLLEQFLFVKLLSWEQKALESSSMQVKTMEVPLEHYNKFHEMANSEDYNDYMNEINYDLTLKSLFNICNILQAQPEIGAVERYTFFKYINILPYYTHGRLINNLWMHLFRVPLADPSTITFRSPKSEGTPFIGFRNLEMLQEGISSSICFICEESVRKRYRSYQLLQQHVHHVHPIYEIICQICPERRLFQSLPNLEAHKLKDHENQSPGMKSVTNENKTHYMITRGSKKAMITQENKDGEMVDDGMMDGPENQDGDMVDEGRMKDKERVTGTVTIGSESSELEIVGPEPVRNAEKFLSRIPRRNKHVFMNNWIDSTVAHNFPDRSKDEDVLQFVVSSLLQSKSVQIHCQEGVGMTTDNVFVAVSGEDCFPPVRVIRHPNSDFIPVKCTRNSQLLPLSSFDDFVPSVSIKTKPIQKKSNPVKLNQKKPKDKNYNDSDSFVKLPDPPQFKELISELLG